MTFDELVPRVRAILSARETLLSSIGPAVINRDLRGRISLVLPESASDDNGFQAGLDELATTLVRELEPHCLSSNQTILYEPDPLALLAEAPHFTLLDSPRVEMVDRVATESRWGTIAPVSQGAPRVVFYSIKGGVGRSTALAISAWWMAQQQGKRVLVCDMDLESPGLSSTLLPAERRPLSGITDWLVEDLVGNGDTVLDDMVATSELSRDGEILVVPAHGKDAGEYLAKLGRVWMPGHSPGGKREPWHGRLERMLTALEERWEPDVILIDSRSGIDEIASTCVTDLRAGLVLLFAHDDDQSWAGYRMLFRNWWQLDMVRDIRDRLQVIGATLPETDTLRRFDELRERSWDVFAEHLYDEIPAGVDPEGDPEGLWNFDDRDESAPHYPWVVRWHRDFTAMASLHHRLGELDADQVLPVFGPLLDGLARYISTTEDAP